VESSATQPDESCIRVKISTPLIRLRARNQGLNEGHFDRFLSHFRAALDEVDVETDKVEKVTKLLESKRCAESLRIFSASDSTQTICGIGDRKLRLRTLDHARNPLLSDMGSSSLPVKPTEQIMVPPIRTLVPRHPCFFAPKPFPRDDVSRLPGRPPWRGSELPLCCCTYSRVRCVAETQPDA